jgi:hypothetical protein
MANTKLSQLDALDTVQSTDELLVVDKSDTTDGADGTSKKVTQDVLTATKADKGANSDITSLSGLTTPLSVAQGGTGAASASAARTALGLVIGTDVQAHDTDLDSWAGKTAPSGTPLGTTDTQTVTNKDLSSATNTFPTSLATLTGTQTLTNKRITKRTGTTTSSATPTIDTDSVDFYSITALAAAITSFTTNLSGTPTEGQTLWIAITDDGTARAITWGASFEASGNVDLPTTTVASTRLDVGFVWNSVTSKFRCIAVS